MERSPFLTEELAGQNHKGGNGQMDRMLTFSILRPRLKCHLLGEAPSDPTTQSSSAVTETRQLFSFPSGN